VVRDRALGVSPRFGLVALERLTCRARYPPDKSANRRRIRMREAHRPHRVRDAPWPIRLGRLAPDVGQAERDGERMTPHSLARQPVGAERLRPLPVVDQVGEPIEICLDRVGVASLNERTRLSRTQHAPLLVYLAEVALVSDLERAMRWDGDSRQDDVRVDDNRDHGPVRESAPRTRSLTRIHETKAQRSDGRR
jgi:hypothetical protein